MKRKVSVTTITIPLVTTEKTESRKKKESDFRARVKGALLIWRQKKKKYI